MIARNFSSIENILFLAFAMLAMAGPFIET
jgi:hypothetical protein